MNRYHNPIPTMIRRLETILSWRKDDPKLVAQWCLRLTNPLCGSTMFQQAVVETVQRLLKFALQDDYKPIYFQIVRSVIEGTRFHSKEERDEKRLKSVEEESFVHLLYESASVSCCLVFIVFATLGLSTEQNFMKVNHISSMII